MRYNILLWILLCIFVFLTGCVKDTSQWIVKEENTKNIVEKSQTKTDGVESDEKENQPSTSDCEEDKETIYVYVCGHVKKPGVYEVSLDARICHALELAGGVSEDGKGDALDQAQTVSDGQTIYVPGVDEVTQGEQGIVKEDDGLVNINTASVDELMTLPGIGEAKATVIYEYRMENGNFSDIEELMQIPGIKEGVYNKIKKQIKV